MALPLESVPNFSEGRDRVVIDRLRGAMSAPADLLDVHVDPDHHRSVYTLVGRDDDLVTTLVRGVEEAIETIDLRRHVGAHPRIGAADVVPIVPIRLEDEPRARQAALDLAERLGGLGLPVFLYGRLTEDGREPAFFRRGGTEELQRRMDSGDVTPAHGPGTLHESAGGVLVGVRRPLIAFNVNLSSQDVKVAKAIASVVRERDGGFPGVRALGLDLPTAGLVQVSMNVTDWEAAALHEIVERISAEAASRGVDVANSELVGLMPAGPAVAAAGSMLRIEGFDASHVLELRLLSD